MNVELDSVTALILGLSVGTLFYLDNKHLYSLPFFFGAGIVFANILLGAHQ